MKTRGARAAGVLLTLTVAGRWLALLFLGYLSLHHWQRSGYLRWSGTWQYGLALTDPRFAAALGWSAQLALFLLLIVYPLARRLEPLIPEEARGQALVAGVLALGLGTRGAVGPLLMRAALAQPLEFLPPGSQPGFQPLTHPFLARLAVAVTEAWWLLPLLVVALRLLRPAPRALIPGLLVFFALAQPLDVPLLLTGGGPQHSTTSIQLLSFMVAPGMAEFGYASALAMLLTLASLLAASLLLPVFRASAAPAADVPHLPPPKPARALWGGVGLLFLLPFIAATARNPGWPVAGGGAWGAALASLGTAAAAAAWAVWLVFRACPGPDSPGLRPGLILPVLFPISAWVLPLVRLGGTDHPLLASWIIPLGLVFTGTPVYLAAGVLLLGRRAGLERRPLLVAAAWACAWATWTELGAPLMLSRLEPPPPNLQANMVWALSTHLWRSPLMTPGWLMAWIIGAVLAARAIRPLLNRPQLELSK